MPFGIFGRLAFVPRRRASAGVGGEHRGRRRAPSLEFVEHRRYQPGDDLRRVDWNVYGRLGTLQVRETVALEQLEIVLVVDGSASMDWGTPNKLGYAARAAAALAYVGLARHDAVRVVHLGAGGPSSFGPLRGRKRFQQLLRYLATFEASEQVDLVSGLAAAMPRTKTEQLLVVLLSDLLAPAGIAPGLDAIRRAGADAVVLHVVSPQELEPAARGDLELVDAETGELLEIGLTGQVLAAYRSRLNDWLCEQEAVCTARGLRYVRLRTDLPIERLMLDDLRRTGVLR